VSSEQTELMRHFIRYVLHFGFLSIIAISMISTRVDAQDTIASRARTPVPSVIAIPDKVETRLEMLKFFAGFPDDKTTEILFENIDLQRAAQSYLMSTG